MLCILVWPFSWKLYDLLWNGLCYISWSAKYIWSSPFLEVLLFANKFCSLPYLNFFFFFFFMLSDMGTRWLDGIYTVEVFFIGSPTTQILWTIYWSCSNRKLTVRKMPSAKRSWPRDGRTILENRLLFHNFWL